jgi:hypothetical protein
LFVATYLISSSTFVSCSECCSGGVCKVASTEKGGEKENTQTKDSNDLILSLLGVDIEDAAGNLHKTKDIVKGKYLSPHLSPSLVAYFNIDLL